MLPGTPGCRKLSSICGFPPILWDERHQPLPQRRKEAVQHLPIHAALILVQQSVIGRFRGRHNNRQSGDCSLQAPAKRGQNKAKSSCALALCQTSSALVAQLFVGHIFVRRDAGQLLAAAAQLLHFAAVDEVQLLGPGAPSSSSSAFVSGQVISFWLSPRQNAHGHAPRPPEVSLGAVVTASR